MPFPIETIVAMALIALVAYTILGISGFGSALVNIPLLAHFLPLTTILPILVLVDFTATSTNGLKFRHDIDVADIKTVVPTMCVGIAIGVALLSRAPGNALLPVLGLSIVVYGLYRLREPITTRFISAKWGYPTGLAGGFIGGLFGIGGPIYATYLSRRTNDFAKMRATMAAIFMVSTAFRIVAFVVAGLLLDSQVWWGFAIILPFMFIGLNIGHKLHGKLQRTHLSYFISALLVASGISLVARVFAA
jgi:uncharacterized membrane protein YfcA